MSANARLALIYGLRARVLPANRLACLPCGSNSIESEKVNARGEMRLEDLPEELASEIRAIQRRYREELEASESDPYGLQFQALLQTNSHKKRLAVFTSILETERKRLTARATLQSMFAKDE